MEVKRDAWTPREAIIFAFSVLERAVISIIPRVVRVVRTIVQPVQLEIDAQLLHCNLVLHEPLAVRKGLENSRCVNNDYVSWQYPVAVGFEPRDIARDVPAREDDDVGANAALIANSLRWERRAQVSGTFRDGMSNAQG